MIDLHIHTVASDGQHTGTEIVALARELGLYALAIADHNSVESVAEAEAAAKKAGIEFAPCLEIDTIYRGRDLHILGYFIAYDSPACETYLKEIYEVKLEQTKKRVQRLQELQFKIEFEELMEISGRRLPTGKHFITALLRREENLKDPRVRAYVDGDRSRSPYLNFYLDWLRAGKPAFIPLNDQPASRAISQIQALGGIPILAHPSDTPVPDILSLLDHGLRGLEVYSSYHTPEMSARFLALALDLNLLVTAGSDFHGPDIKPDVQLAGVPGNDDRLFYELKKAKGSEVKL